VPLRRTARTETKKASTPPSFADTRILEYYTTTIPVAGCYTLLQFSWKIERKNVAIEGRDSYNRSTEANKLFNLDRKELRNV
jgi:hypothetical protein